MAVKINDLGNGSGYLYITDSSDNILTAEINTPQGYRNIRASGLTAAPIAARKSSTGSITVTSASGAGSVTDITINGVTQIATGFAITSTTPSDVAIDIASYINAYTPITGYNYSAVVNGDLVEIIAPSDVGAIPNGYVVAISKTGTSTFTTSNMNGGSSNASVIDDVLGLKFYLNSDPSAVPTTISGAVDVTKFLVTRGLQTGVVIKDIQIEGDSVYNIDRASSITLVNLTPQTGLSDKVAFIDPTDFIEGDILMIRSASSTYAITVESAPTSTSTAPIKNVYLASDLDFRADEYQTLILQYRYIDGVGAGFVESSRSISIKNTFNIYNTDGTLSGDRTVDGDTHNLAFINIYDLAFTSTHTFVVNSANIGLSIDGNTGLLMQNNLIQTTVNNGPFNLYAATVNVNAGQNDLSLKATTGSVNFNTAAYFNVLYRDSFIYKLPVTMPASGQTLKAVDGAGTLGWV